MMISNSMSSMLSNSSRLSNSSACSTSSMSSRSKIANVSWSSKQVLTTWATEAASGSSSIYTSQAVWTVASSSRSSKGSKFASSPLVKHSEIAWLWNVESWIFPSLHFSQPLLIIYSSTASSSHAIISQPTTFPQSSFTPKSNLMSLGSTLPRTWRATCCACQVLNCCRKWCLRGHCSTTSATWSLLVQFAGTNIVLMRGNRSSIHSLKPAEMCTF